ncbi:MAG: FG-GAP and VCBS repeat-containing protein [Sumerlaeia bacterium]
MADPSLLGIQQIFLDDAEGGQRGQPVKAGDFDGDGSMDSVALPFYAHQRNESGQLIHSRNGKAIVFFGDGTTSGTIDNATYTGRRLEIVGAVDSAILGVESEAGDLDGDGYDDLILGSTQGLFRDEPGAAGAGEVVVLYGNPDWGNGLRNLDLAELPASQRARFYVGPGPLDRMGAWLRIADLDGDGCQDLIMSVDLSDGVVDESRNSGALAIAWGRGMDRGGMTRVTDVPTSHQMTMIFGVDRDDLFAATHTVGDWDGDGRLDLAVAAGVSRSGLQTVNELQYSASGGGDGPPGDSRFDAGEVTILWDAGRLRSFPVVFTAFELPAGLDMTVVYGDVVNGKFGEEIVAGDLDGDGTQDLIVGALNAFNSAGEGYVVFGGPLLRSIGTFDIRNPAPGLDLWRFPGPHNSAIAADTLHVGDVNRDGIHDLFYAVPQGNVRLPDRRLSNGGHSILIYGSPVLRTIDDISYRVGESDEGPAGIVWDREPEFLWTVLTAIDSGDLFAYSAYVKDMTNDGVPDYLPNSMQGDGFDNAFRNAGEFFVVDGWELSRRAAAPRDVAGSGENGLVWNASQPVLGQTEVYQVWIRNEDASTTTVAVTVRDDEDAVPYLHEASPGQFPMAVRAVQRDREGETRYSEWAWRENAEPILSPDPNPLPKLAPPRMQVANIAELLNPLLFQANDCTPAYFDGSGDHLIDIADFLRAERVELP